jgi:predicted NUDIX family NTP pyrophosphohydrolase
MAARSAGLLIFRQKNQRTEVLLVHPGGPFWAKKDAAAWSIPKGLVDEGEDELAAAQREVEEEIGTRIEGDFYHLGEYRQRSGKIVVAWAVEAEVDITAITSNTFSMEWPPRSGIVKEFPEVDRAGWFTLDEAEDKILKGQKAILEDFVDRQARRGPPLA